jgi:hypothetical protein
MKKLLLTNWHSMRWIRLAIGLFLIQQAIQHQLVLYGFMAAFFLFQSLFNTGCSINRCGVSPFKNNKNE